MRRSTRYTSSGSAAIGREKRCEGTTWKISPSTMSRTASWTAASYSRWAVRALGSSSLTVS